jgi:hypothetical protein
VRPYFTRIDESHGKATYTACDRMRLILTAPELPLMTGRRGSDERQMAGSVPPTGASRPGMGYGRNRKTHSRCLVSKVANGRRTHNESRNLLPHSCRRPQAVQGRFRELAPMGRHPAPTPVIRHLEMSASKRSLATAGSQCHPKRIPPVKPMVWSPLWEVLLQLGSRYQPVFLCGQNMKSKTTSTP